MADNQDYENEMSTDDLLEQVNREEEFRKMVTMLLSSESSEIFDTMSEVADSDNPESMKEFIGDLKAIYDDEPLRLIVKLLLQDFYSVPQMRGLNLLLSSHIRHLKRVQEMNKQILSDARHTIEHYLPAFEGLVHFLEELTGDNSDFDNSGAELLNEEFIADISAAIEKDNRVNRDFLLSICRDQDYRTEIKEAIPSYPKVVSYIFGLADQLVQAKNCLEEIEINEMLHDIEGHEEW